MRVGILTALPSFEPYYSVARCVRDQVAMLTAAGIDVRLYVKVGFNPTFGTLPCIAEAKTPGFMTVEGRTQETVAQEFAKVYGHGELEQYDAVFTHDFMFLPSLRGFRDGVKLIAPTVKKPKWFHWSHSVPRSLGAAGQAIDGHIYVALAKDHIQGVMDMYHAALEQVHVVWNPSDILDTVDSRTRGVAEQLRLLDTDILGVLPFSIGRLNQKGIEVALPIYAELSHRYRVKVLLCNSLSDLVEGQIARAEWDVKLKTLVAAVKPGDFQWWWMSEVVPGWARYTPNEVIRDLFRLSNLMVYPTIGEGFSLAIGEALSSGGPLCVLPEKGVKGMEELAELGGVQLVSWRNKPWREDKTLRSTTELANEIDDGRLSPYVQRLHRQWALSRTGIWEKQLNPMLDKHVRV